ncbi:hypothetical protein IQ215_13855 [Cyanobacterium stanieri LEGE 03274]|uniref:Uncharacterized protein n=1 Tax=Cyanobacterium stanieri LEGE 03274 TaxID=1828756 RepID=A0ABR9V7A7_9CHRO|nr:hypothetical protein [Cyanobacterium stanieri]MBE9223782.1 hypothetical protein [Cyanobacterium stanieri LEGE 03274]
MNFEQEERQLVDKLVTYFLELNRPLILVENVPARVNEKTGEKFFAPDIVERLQDMILGDEKPLNFIRVPVYQFNNVA